MQFFLNILAYPGYTIFTDLHPFGHTTFLITCEKSKKNVNFSGGIPTYAFLKL